MSKEYWQLRTSKIKEKVSLRSLIDRYRISCQSDGNITQVHCPFHGKDNHASARIYDTNTMYCWVCSRSWDVINFIKDYEKISFSEACKFLEKNYGIEKTDALEVYSEPTFEDYLNSVSKDVKNKDFEKEFFKISKMLKINKDKLNLDKYSKYFYYLDNLYSNYKLNKYTSDLSIQLSLDNLHQEIFKQI
jgi:Glu-tRNA(Gln) amidotransferase subunit E-like FAD-binding protein